MENKHVLYHNRTMLKISLLELLIMLHNKLGFYSRRINKKHRIIYEVYEKENAIKILRMWTHYQ